MQNTSFGISVATISYKTSRLGSSVLMISYKTPRLGSIVIAINYKTPVWGKIGKFLIFAVTFRSFPKLCKIMYTLPIHEIFF